MVEIKVRIIQKDEVNFSIEGNTVCYHASQDEADVAKLIASKMDEFLINMLNGNEEFKMKNFKSVLNDNPKDGPIPPFRSERDGGMIRGFSQE